MNPQKINSLALQKAIRLSLRSEKLKPGSAAYNLACIFGLLNSKEECKNWLIIAKENHTLPEKEHILKDTDLNSIRELSWFKEFISTL